MMVASGALITLFAGSDISLEDIDAIHDEFVSDGIGCFSVMVVIGVAFEPMLLGNIVISVVVVG